MSLWDECAQNPDGRQTGSTPPGRAESEPESGRPAEAEAVVAERPPAPVPVSHDACRPAPVRRSGQRNPEVPAAQEVATGLRVAQAKAPVPRVAQ
ncbi:hypothetical protein PR202_gb08382 [Eleusine coracana subsp. coracana]|uniref:Uncharacterized protein n=1 Tax=Eleusine coracana subsp. coracana TaxID=191504 RepID=A0AAV5EDS1_ELECO|nr:hypothetical protein PR202_gb08382 [Eleusine coracana subsp. coracana]